MVEIHAKLLFCITLSNYLGSLKLVLKKRELTPLLFVQIFRLKNSSKCRRKEPPPLAKPYYLVLTFKLTAYFEGLKLVEN